MKSLEFSQKVKDKQIKNGSKFEVYDKNKEYIGIVGVIDTTVVYLNMKQVPTDLAIGDYTFELIEDENE